MDDILREALVPAPNNPVTLIGGVIVFCDPGTTLSIPLMDGRWKVAVGLQPKSFNHDETYLDQVSTLVQSNSLVAALGKIGLDRTVPDYLLDEQERTFQRLLTFCHPKKFLVLHLRGYPKVHSSDVLNTGLQYVQKACSRDQRIHLHCFTGRRVDLEDWLEDFPNCHFGFTAKVLSFNDPQIEILRAVPNNRILLETDSPYMPVEPASRNQYTCICGRYSLYGSLPQIPILGGVVGYHSSQWPVTLPVIFILQYVGDYFVTLFIVTRFCNLL